MKGRGRGLGRTLGALSSGGDSGPAPTPDRSVRFDRVSGLIRTDQETLPVTGGYLDQYFLAGMWFKTDEYAHGDTYSSLISILKASDPFGGGEYFTLFMNRQDNPPIGPWRYQIAIEGPGFGAHTVFTVTPGEWTHVAVARQEGRFIVFVNGTAQAFTDSEGVNYFEIEGYNPQIVNADTIVFGTIPVNDYSWEEFAGAIRCPFLVGDIEQYTIAQLEFIIVSTIMQEQTDPGMTMADILGSWACNGVADLSDASSHGDLVAVGSPVNEDDSPFV